MHGKFSSRINLFVQGSWFIFIIYTFTLRLSMCIKSGYSGIKSVPIAGNDFKHDLFYVLRIFKRRSKIRQAGDDTLFLSSTFSIATAGAMDIRIVILC